MFVCPCKSMSVSLCHYVCMYVCMHICMYVSTYVCMACMHARMYMCVIVSILVYDIASSKVDSTVLFHMYVTVCKSLCMSVYVYSLVK